MSTRTPDLPIGRRLFRPDRPSIGIGITALQGPGLLSLLARGGADYVLIDMEHTSYSMRDVAYLMAGARTLELPVIVRPPEVSRNAIGRLLDIGADGILTPLLAGPDEAGAAVQFAKYRPIGVRGDDGRISGAETVAPSAMAELINDNTVLIAGIETPRAAEEIETICKIPGLDAIWIGNSDLSLGLGQPGDFSAETYRKVQSRVIETCRQYGVPYAVGVATTPAAIREHIDLGCFTVSPESETDLLLQAVANYALLVEQEVSRGSA